jgi:hypothetical protein
MFQIHPADIDAYVHLRQEIVQQGINASRHPGDLAGLRDLIGRVLITAGEKIRGCQAQAAASQVPGSVMQMAR